MKKIFALVLSVFLLAGMFLILAVADESADEQFITIFEENFEDYENNVNVSSTLMPNFFVCDYNAIGDGVIHVQETANGNLLRLRRLLPRRPGIPHRSRQLYAG